MRFEETTNEKGRTTFHIDFWRRKEDGSWWTDETETERVTCDLFPEFSLDGDVTWPSCNVYLTPPDGLVSDRQRELTNQRERAEARNAALVAKEMLVFGPQPSDLMDDPDFQHELDEIERREAEIERRIEERKFSVKSEYELEWLEMKVREEIALEEYNSWKSEPETLACRLTNKTFDQLDMIKRVKGMTTREVLEWLAGTVQRGWLVNSLSRPENRVSHADASVREFRCDCAVDDYLSQAPTISRARGAEPTRQLRVELGQASYWRLVKEGYQQERSLSALITELLMKQGSEKALKGRIRRNETGKTNRAKAREAATAERKAWGLEITSAPRGWNAIADSMIVDAKAEGQEAPPEDAKKFWDEFRARHS